MAESSGQALLEFSFIVLLLVVLAFGLIDFGRAIYRRQILINISREGANLASRGTSFTNTISALVLSAAPLDIAQDGRVILTAVTRDQYGNLLVTDQLARGGLDVAVSRVAPGGIGTSQVSLPSTEIPKLNQVLIVAEVFHKFDPITPIGKLLGVALPSIQYDVAFF